MVKDAFSLALDIAMKWEWSKVEAEQLVKDIVLYANEEKPFASGLADAKEWWEQIVGYHPLKGLALKLGAIVPHAAEVDALIDHFSIPTPFTVGSEDAELEDLGDFTMKDIEAEFEALEQTGFTSADGNNLSVAVPVEQVYNTYLIDQIHVGQLPSTQVIDLEAQEIVENDKEWDAGSLMRAMGLQ
ncbi:hypothetical protein BDQ17DRAFT_1428633 [Cyathus striatus]|nr:hypothetical protein BDQ17DRAFT_1428633 [Cyathus striatus]